MNPHSNRQSAIGNQAIPKGFGIAIVVGLGRIRPGVDKLQVIKPDVAAPFQAIGIYKGPHNGLIAVEFEEYGTVALPIWALREPEQLESWIDRSAFADGYMVGFGARYSDKPIPDFSDTTDSRKLGMLKGWRDASVSHRYRADRACRFNEPYNDVVRCLDLKDNAGGVTLGPAAQKTGGHHLRFDSNPKAWRQITAKRNSSGDCGHRIETLDVIGFNPNTRHTKCADCWKDHLALLKDLSSRATEESRDLTGNASRSQGDQSAIGNQKSKIPTVELRTITPAQRIAAEQRRPYDASESRRPHFNGGVR
jgi:hypothetical protein